jgi:hypothetical protein
VFPFPLVTAKLLGDYFDDRQYGANKAFFLIKRQFFCAQNHQSVKRDAVRTRKKSASSKMFNNSRCKFDPHCHWRNKKEWYILNNTGIRIF